MTHVGGTQKDQPCQHRPGWIVEMTQGTRACAKCDADIPFDEWAQYGYPQKVAQDATEAARTWHAQHGSPR